MGCIAIVTDSSASIPPELVREYGIVVVPIRITLDGRTYRDGVDIVLSEFYRLLEKGTSTPRTAGPPIGDFLEVYRSLAKQVEAIVSIHVPRRFSSIVDTASLAQREVPTVPIHVVDAGTAAGGLGLVVQAAARAVQAGASLDEILARIDQVSARVYLIATIERLDFLHRSGRVPAIVALMGSLLKLRPILQIAEGKVTLLETPRTRHRAIQRMLEQVAARVLAAPVHVAIFHAAAPEDAAGLKEKIAARFDCRELYVSEFTAVMGAHTGPGVLGIGFYTEPEGEARG